MSTRNLHFLTTTLPEKKVIKELKNEGVKKFIDFKVQRSIIIISFFILSFLNSFISNSQVCVPSSELSITVAKKPVVTITGSTTVCTGGNAVLIANMTGGIGTDCDIVWQYSDNLSDWFAIPLAKSSILQLSNLTRTSNYRAVYTCGGEGCDSKPSNVQQVVVVPQPIVSLSASNLSICENTPVTLTAAVQGGTGSDVYTWYSSTDGSNYTKILAQNAPTLTYSPTVTSYFKVSVTEPGDGCTGTSSAVQINVDGCRGSIGDYTWLDCNKNGIQDGGEVGLANVPVTLTGTPTDGTVFTPISTITNGSGLYLFNNLKPGKYFVTFGFPTNISGLIFTGKNRANINVDSDVDATGKSDEITLTANQNITSVDAGYIDNAAPVFASAPSDITIECDQPLVFASVNASDNINKAPLVTFKDDSTALDCKLAQKLKQKYTRTWTADDGCGNVSTLKQNITTRDTKPPVFNKSPADITVACGLTLPNGADIIATDACEGKVNVLLTQPFDKICASSGVYHRTYLATDGCNNTASVSHNITVIDTVAPLFVGLPIDITVSCSAQIPDVPNITLNDNCDVAATLTRDADDSIPGACAGSYKIIRHWTAVDACGNTRKAQQVISLFDTESPSIVNVPTDITVECKNVPPAIALTVKDNCDTKLSSVLPSDVKTNGSCAANYTITRTWVATDACGNATTKSQTITVRDTAAPVLANIPSDITVNVGLGDVIPNAPINIAATDNCDNNPKITSNEIPQTLAGNCKNILVRTWQAKDACGNTSALQKQTITVLDSVTGVRIASRTSANCVAADGSVSISPANYTYSWSDNGAGNIRTDLKAGNYTVTISKSASCNIVFPVIVDSVKCLLCDKPVVSITRTKQTCAKGNDGTATISFQQSANGFQLTSVPNILWKPTADSSKLTADGLLVGTTYTVRIARKDNDTCFVTTQFSIDQATDVVIADPTITNADCNISTGSAKFSPTGNLKFTFKWPDGDTNSVRNSLAIGNYPVTVSDGLNCPIVKTVQMTKVCNNPCIKPILTAQISNQSCAKTADGKIIIRFQGSGVGNQASDFTLNIVPNVTWSLTPDSSFLIPNLAPGTYSLRIQKKSDPTCFVDTSLQILPAVDIIPPTPTITKAICDASSGTISFQPSAINYQFVWTDGNTSSTRNSLARGSYSVKISVGANSNSPLQCPVTQTYVIDSINNLSATYTINKQPTCAINNGSVTINPKRLSGDTTQEGSNNYSYSWGSTNTRAGLGALTYTVTVTDKQTGCTTVPTFTLINQTVEAAIQAVAVVNLQCADVSDGRINYTVIPGKNFVSPAKVTLVDAQNNIVTNGSLAAGSYTILVNDATDCFVTQKSFTVIAPQPTTGTIKGESQVCNNSSILLESTILNPTGNCTYQWQRSFDGVSNWQNIPNATSSSYTVNNQTQKTYYRLQFTCGFCPPQISNTLDVTNVPSPTVSTTIFGGNTTLCAGATFTITTAVSPSNSLYKYQWQTSTDGKNWTKIQGAVSATYSGVMNASAQYRVVVTPLIINCDVISDPPVKLTLADCKGSIGNYAWLDCNKNGIQDVGEKGLNNVGVSISGTADDGTTVQLTTTSDANGYYSFSNIKLGKYSIVFSAPSGTQGLKFTTQNAGRLSGDTTPAKNDSKADATGRTDVFTLAPSTSIDYMDVGFFDDIKPQFTFSPQDKNVECGQTPQFDIATATDNLLTTVKLDSVTTTVKGTCPTKYITTRTWTATDDCGNTASISQKIYINDNTAPILGAVPADISVECGKVPAAPQNITATDNCDAVVKITFTEKKDSVCKFTYKISRTWIATDSCGNTSIPKSQIITVKDTIKPVLVNVPTDITVDLANNGVIPALPTDVYATDNCDANPSLVPTQSVPEFLSNCTTAIKRTWKATDACGNFNSLTQTITVLDAIKDVVVVSNKPENCTKSDGHVEFAPANYTYNWSDGKSGAIRNDLKATDYSVTISKNANCSIVQKITVTRDCPNNCVAPILTVQKTNQTCTRGNDGTATINISNGNVADYKFTWSASAVSNNQTATNLSVGDYSVRVEKLTDPTCFDIIKFTISPAVDVVIAPPTITNADCNILTGSASFAITDTIKYKFKWNDGDTNRTRSGLALGVYTVTVSRSNYCDAVVTVPINTSCTQTCIPPIITVDVTSQSCEKKNDGKAVVNFVNTADTLNYKFNWSPIVSQFSTAYNLAPGDYTVRVVKATDATCFIEKTFTVNAAKDLVVAAPQITPASCTSPTGSVLFNGTGAEKWTYKWNDGDTNRLRTKIIAGNYNVTVSDRTGALCSIVIPVVVPNTNPLKTTFVINSQPTCGKPNGYVTLNTTGGSGDYSYSWGEGNSRFVLFAGVTTVTATDRQTGCQTQVTFTLVNQTVEATVAMDSVINLACNGDKNARLTYQVTPGQGFHFPMSVEVRDSQNNVVNNGALGAGRYVLVVADSSGCIAAKRNFRVAQPEKLTLAVVKADQTCDSSGHILVNLSGGTSTYKLSLINDHGVILSPLVSNNSSLIPVSVGTYSVMVTDAAQCQNSAKNIVISDSCLCRPPVIDSVFSAPATCGLPNGSATVVLKNHTEAQYQFDWSPASGFSNSVGNGKTGISGGVYNVLITSLNNADCYANATVGVGSLDGPKNITFSTKPATCDLANGSVILSPAPVDSLTYTWLFDGSNAYQRNDLKAGYYQVLVSRNSLSNCPTLINVKVESVNNLQAQGVVALLATCGESNGQATIKVTGSKYQLTYSWGNSDTRNDLKAGVYTVTVIEAQSQCRAVASFTVPNKVRGFAKINLVDSIVTTRCSDSKDATINYQISYDANFAQPSTVKITDAQGKEYTNENLGVGQYCIIVRDANNCVAGSACFEVRAPQPLFVYANETNRTCDVGGSIVLTTSGGSGIMRYSWSDNIALNQAKRDDLAVGAYAVTVSDTKGCTVILDTLHIRNDCPAPPPCNVKATYTALDKGCNTDGSIKITVTSGVAPFVFDWLDIAGANNPQNRVGLQKGNYTVVITDAQNCKDTLRNIAIDDKCVNPQPCTPPQFANTNVVDSKCGTATGSISYELSALSNGLSFKVFKLSAQGNQIVNLVTQGSQLTAQGLDAGTYIVKLVRNNDSTCFSTKTLIVRNQDGLTVASPAITPATCTAPNGVVEFLGTDASYTYIWIDGQSGAKRTDLTAGNYTITVSDINNIVCKQIISVVVPTTNTLSATTNIIREPSCGNSDGQANIRVTNGSGSYSFSWGASNSRTNLVANNYSVTVSDNVSGCSTITTFILNNAVSGISEVQLASKVIYTSCAGVNDGNVEFTLKNSPTFAAPARVVIKSAQGNTVPKDSLSVGKYTIAVFDDNNCLAGSDAFEVKSPDAIGFSASVESQKCTTLGKISLSLSGGSGAFTQTWSNGSVTNNGILNNLRAGRYSVTVTDGRKCSVVQKDITVANDSVNCTPVTCPKLASNTVTDKTCGSLGKIQLNLIGGTAPYSYNWSLATIGNQSLASNLNEGNYSVTITDGNGCKDTLKNILVRNNCPACTLFVTDSIAAKTCSRGGEIYLRVSGGSGGYKVSFQQSAFSNQLSFKNLNKGNYTVIVLDTVTQCRDTLNDITIVDSCSTNVCTLRATAQVVDKTCTADGSISFELSALSYELFLKGDNGYYLDTVVAHSSKLIAQGLKEGTYSVIVRDNASTCADTVKNIVIKDVCPPPPTCNLKVSAQATNRTCDVNGTIQLRITNYDLRSGYKVASPQNLVWKANADSSLLTADGLFAGNYSVIISDGQGCTAVVDNIVVRDSCNGSHVINPNCPMTASASVEGVNCNTPLAPSLGSIIVNVNNGSGNFAYTWSDAVINSPIRTNLNGGTYSVIILDIDSQCLDTLSNIYVRGDTCSKQTTCILKAYAQTTNKTCDARNNTILGTSVIVVTGAIEPVKYNWNDGVDGANSNSPLRNDLNPGTYSVTVTDASNCTVVLKNIIVKDSCSITIDTNATCKLVVSAAVTPKNCTSAGIIKLNVTGGSGKYAYVWSDNATVNSPNRTKLNAGTYTVIVKDTSSTSKCTTTLLSILVTDNCSEVCTLSATAKATNKSCDVLGSIQLRITNYELQTNYPVVIRGNNGFVLDTIVKNEITDIRNLNSGKYTITLTNAIGCSYIINNIVVLDSCQTPITNTCKLVASAKVTAKTCTEGGILEVVVTGGKGKYQFVWSDIAGINSSTRTNLAEGIYSVIIKDSTGCADTLRNISLLNTCSGLTPCTLKATAQVIDKTCTANGKITISTNIAGNLTYSWSDNANRVANMASLQAGTYSVTVKDITTNCADTVRNVVVKDVCPTPTCTLKATAQVVNKTCAANGSIIISANSTNTLNYTWSDNAGINSASRTNLQAGSYTVIVKEAASSCADTIRNIIVLDTCKSTSVCKLRISAQVTDKTCAAGGAIAISTNIVGNYTYAWSDNVGINAATRTDLAAGIYSVTVKDATTNCADTLRNITVLNTCPIPTTCTLKATAQVVNKTCVANGSIIISANSTNTLNYTWSDNAGINSASRTNLQAGSYTVICRDAMLGGSTCADTIRNIIVLDTCKSTSVCKLRISAQVTDKTCAAGGAIAISTNIVGNYTYSWSDNVGINAATRTDLAAGIYSVTVKDAATNCADTLRNITVLNTCPIPTTCTLKATAQVVNKTCVANGSIIISANSTNTLNYTWSDNAGLNSASRTNLQAGSYTVIVKEAASSCADTIRNIIVLDNCTVPTTTRDTIYRSVLIGKKDTLCLTLDTSSIKRITALMCDGTTQSDFYFGSAEINAANCMVYTAGNIPGNDKMCMRICSSDGKCREVTIFEEVKKDSARYISTKSVHFDTLIYVGRSMTLCFAPNGVAATITPACATRYRNLVGYKITNNNGCVTLTGLSTGRDTLCFSVCRNGVCDTVTAYIIVKPFITPADTTCKGVLQYAPTDGPIVLTTVCGTKATLCTKLEKDDTLNYRIFDNGKQIFTGFDFCGADTSVSYSYFPLIFSRPSGSWHLDEWVIGGIVHQGDFYSIQAIVDSMNVWNPTAQWRLDAATLSISSLNNNRKYGAMLWSRLGLPIAEMEPNVHLEFSKLALPLSDGSHTVIFENTIKRCSDTVNVTVKCIPHFKKTVDSVQLSVSSNKPTTNNYQPTIKAYNDYVRTTRTRKVYIEPLKNDSLGGVKAKIASIGKPITGKAELDTLSREVITYTPQNNPCEPRDSFSYQLVTISNDPTRDSTKLIAQISQLKAYVIVEIICDELMVYTAFSPNQDGINDAFTIEGLEKYPNSTLTVYNRWGNQVFESKNYDNTWMGTYQGAALPDGTYFWMIELPNKETKTGMVQIQR